MPTPSFPSALKPVVSQGYSFNAPDNVIVQPVAGGSPLMMLDYKTAQVAFNVTLVLNPLKMQVFSDFYFGKIQSGSGKFTMNLDSGNGIEEHICNIAPNTLQHNSNDTQIWIVSFTILAEKTPAQDDPFGGTLVDLYEIYGDNLFSILNRIEKFALVDLPTEFEP